MSDARPDEPTSPTSNDPSGQERDPASFSPGAGCIIIVLAVSLFCGAAAYAIYAGIRQDRDIAKFTTEQALELPDDPGTPAELAAARAKLDTFRETVRNHQPATLELSTRDLNILIHNETDLIDIRDMVYFETISSTQISGQISMPMNRLAFWKPKRFLNGTFTMTLESSPGKLFLRLKNIEAPGKEIPPGFIERIAQDDLLNPYKNEGNEDIFETIQSATMDDGVITIKSTPRQQPQP